MEISNFTEKFNELEGVIYTVEEVVTVTGGIYIGTLAHDNINLKTLNVYTGTMLTDTKITDYVVSTPSETPWKNTIRIYASVSPVYISYETIGDKVEAEDINNVQDAIVDTQENLNVEIDRAKIAENTVADNLNNEITRATNAENSITNVININKPIWDDKYTKVEVMQKISDLVNAAPQTLDTLKEIADALGNDPNFSTTIINLLGEKVDKEIGKQLSAEDYTTIEKNRLAGVQENANNYVHPSTHPATIITEDATHRFTTDEEKVLWNNNVSSVVGNLSVLDTTDKTNIVSAINENTAQLSDIVQEQAIQNDNIGLKADQTSLATTNATVALKSDKTYVDTKTQANNLAYKESYATLSELQTAYPSGDTYNHTVLADGFIHTWVNSSWTSTNVQANGTGIANNSIAPAKLTFYTVEGKASKNMFNKYTITSGKYVDYLTGTIQTSAINSASDYIAISPSTLYCMKYAGQIAWYDSNKIFISGTVNIRVFTSPATAYYVRITTLLTNLDIQQFELGGMSTDYVSYFNSTLKDESISPTKLDLRLNILNNYKISSGVLPLLSYNDIATGSLTAFYHWGIKVTQATTVNAIKLKNETDYKNSLLCVAVYDLSFNLLTKGICGLTLGDNLIIFEKSVDMTNGVIFDVYAKKQSGNLLKEPLKMTTTKDTNSTIIYYSVTATEYPGTFAVAGGSYTGINYVLYNLSKSDVMAYPVRYPLCQEASYKSIIVVGKGSDCDFTTIAEAIASITNDSITNQFTILLKPGVYNEIISLINRYISIKGYSKNNTFIKTTTGKYSDAPIMTGGGNAYYENVTFLATHDNLYSGYASDTNYAYAVHADFGSAGTVEFFNCDLISYQSSALGAGLFTDQTMIYRNCKFKSIYTDVMPVSDIGAMLLHTSGVAGSNNQNAIFDNCTFETTGRNYGLRLLRTASDMNVLFKNCYVKCPNGQILLVDNQNNSATFHPIDSTSFGNNLASINGTS